MPTQTGLFGVQDPINQKKVTDDPGNLTPLTISAVSASGSGGSKTITWTTSASGSSLVRYGRNPNLDQVTSEMDTNPLVTSHSVVLSGLTVGKVYLFQVQSRLGGGKDGVGRSVMNGYTFTQSGSFVA